MMKISLVIQCIDTFGFAPAEDKLRFFADGRRFCPVRKSGGFYIASNELPPEFALSVQSDVYYDCESRVDAEKGIFRVNLMRKKPPPRRSAVWLDTGEFGAAALEYGFFYLGESLESGDERIIAENPYRFCLEGRSFLLLDTLSGAEEFIVLERAENALMTDYLTSRITNGYSAEHSVLLPALGLYARARIPLEKPCVGGAAVRLYDKNGNKVARVKIDAD